MAERLPVRKGKCQLVTRKAYDGQLEYIKNGKTSVCLTAATVIHLTANDSKNKAFIKGNTVFLLGPTRMALWTQKIQRTNLV